MKKINRIIDTALYLCLISLWLVSTVWGLIKMGVL